MRHLLPTLALLASAAHAHDWPQWRGPARDNVSTETEWSSVGAEEQLWRARIGRGYSSPVVAAGRLYATGYFEDEDTPGEGLDEVRCIDVGTGEELWVRAFPASAYDNEHAGGTLSTPTLHGGRLYVASRGGAVRAFDAGSGDVIWEVDLVERHGVDPGRYGFASAPYVYGDAIVLNAESTLSIDRSSGGTNWISESFGANFSTVAELQRGELSCLVVFGQEGLVLVDGATGEEVSRATFMVGERNVEGATPVVLDQRVIISSGYEQGIACYDFEPDEPVQLWRSRKLRTKMAGSTLYDGHLYGFDESMLKCLDLEGNELWRKRGLGHGAVSVAGGRLLVTSSRGELVVAAASPDGYAELSRRRVIEYGGVYWAAPVLVDGRIYIRASEGELACLDHRAASSALAAAGPGLREDAPTPESVLERYFAATGLAEHELPALAFHGTLQNDSLGIGTCEAHWQSDAAGRWRARFYLKPYRTWVTQVYDGTIGWQGNPFEGNSAFEADKLAEYQRTNGLRAVFQPVPASVQYVLTRGREMFHDIECFRLDAVFGEEDVRQLYFDVETDLLVGRTSEREATVLYGDWRELGDVRLPHRRIEYDLENGEQWTWAFTEVEVLEALDDEDFIVPDDLGDDEQDEGEEG